MFCSICQKAFKKDKNYNLHLKSSKHKQQSLLFEENPTRYKRQIGSRLALHFMSFISRLEEYTEINAAYGKYITGNKYRIKGSCYKSLIDLIPDIRKGIVLKTDSDRIYVKGREAHKQREPFIGDISFNDELL